MTYRELMEAVRDLGFDASFDADATLVSATNRALRQIGRFCPCRSVRSFTAREPVLFAEEEQRVADELVLRAAGAMALSFEYIGQGRMQITGVDSKAEVLGSPRWRAKKIILSAAQALTLTLTGSSRFSVRRVAFFGAVDDIDGEAQLPVIGKRAQYELAAFFGDMIDIGAPPMLEDGTALPYEVTDGVLAISREVEGIVTLTARRRPAAVTLDCFAEPKWGGTVDIAESAADLLPLLVAAYVFLDVEPQKAAYYKQLYDEQHAMWRRQQKFGGDRVIHHKGWR